MGNSKYLRGVKPKGLRVRRQLELFEGYLRDFQEFRERGESLYALERIAQLLIQSLLDLGAMLAVYLGRGKPEAYRGIAEFISSLIGEEHKTFLVELAGFRNLLVHGYARIDRRLEDEAFREMEERLPIVLDKLRGYIDADEIDPRELRGVEEVFRRYGVRYALLFGSRARGETGRDYDIAVSVELKSALEMGGLLMDLAEALGCPETSIDLIHIDSAPMGILYTLLNEGVIIYGDHEEALADLSRRYIELLDLRSTITYVEKSLKSIEESSKPPSSGI
ncbi:MAG: hypothetical protein DRN61_04980 [Thaumarchaeota archaeon]|nr:MAG: hypothetical protein DRN61_04980 [Nitrososphaerota archaeon]